SMVCPATSPAPAPTGTVPGSDQPLPLGSPLMALQGLLVPPAAPHWASDRLALVQPALPLSQPSLAKLLCTPATPAITPTSPNRVFDRQLPMSAPRGLHSSPISPYPSWNWYVTWLCA